MTPLSASPGPDLRAGANWAVAQRPPQLRGLHKKTVKNYFLRKHKKYFLKLIMWNKK